MAVRLLHTADWQIGKGFGYIPDDAGALVRTQRIETIRTLARLAREKEVDAVLVAGDVFEMNTVADRTLRQTLDALGGYPGPWLLLPGNHDAALAESVWTRLRRLGVADNVRLLTEPTAEILADGRLAVLPAPLQRRHETRDLTDCFDTLETPAGALRVGLAHGSVENRLPENSEAYNPIADDRAEKARLDYLALGDWHGTLDIAPRTWYAGTPETDRFHSNDSGNALIVTLEEVGSEPRVEKVRTGHYRWHRLERRLQDREDLAVLEADLSALGAPWDRQIVRLNLNGTLGLEARRELDTLLACWQARFRHLDLQDDHLALEATEEDFGQLALSGYLADTLTRLQTIQHSPGDSRQAHAAAALQRFYSELNRQGG